MALAENLHHAMEIKGVQASELSELSGVKPSRISEIVTGKTKNPQLKTLQKLSAALGISVDSLTENINSFMVKENHSGYGITANENKLLAYFRKLTPEQQTSIMQHAIGLLALKNTHRKGNI